jgi:hypothetical protein
MWCFSFQCYFFKNKYVFQLGKEVSYLVILVFGGLQ